MDVFIPRGGFHGATIDFLLSARRDTVAAERFLTKALDGENHPAPRVINTDKHAAYPPAIVELKADGVLEEKCRHRPVQYLNNVLEQDHRAIKRRVNASQGFRSFWAAWRTLAGYEVIHMIRKGQACWREVLQRFDSSEKSRFCSKTALPKCLTINEWIFCKIAKARSFSGKIEKLQHFLRQGARATARVRSFHFGSGGRVPDRLPEAA